jgi:hypothetical protein
MKRLALALFATLTAGVGTVGTMVVATTEPAHAQVYCTYIGYPVGCVVRPGVVLRPRPVGRAVAREAVRPGTPGNRGGPVNRKGRR